MSSYYEKKLATGEVKCIDEEVPFEIPKGWEWVRLNSYSDVRDGTHDTPQYVVSGYPLITSKDFIGGIFDFSKTKYIDERTFIEINKRSNVQIGDILFSMIGGNIGSMILIRKENYFDMAIKNVALFKHYIYNDILIKYLYLYLQSQVVSIKNTASGGAQSFVSLNMLRNYLMPIPPLNEQNRIIEKFKSLDFVIQRYKKSYRKLNNLKQELFPKLRKSILQEAIQGKLVPQIAEEGTAQELLKQIKEEKNKLAKEGKLKKSALNDSVIFKGDDNKYYTIDKKEKICIDDEMPFDIPDTWQWCRLGTLFSHCTGKALNASNLKGSLMTYITTSNLYWNRFELDNLKRMRFTDEEIEKCTATLGDLLVCEGGDIGRAAIWNYPYDIRIQNHIHKLRAYKLLCTKFFFWVFYFYKATGQIGGKGIGIQGLSSKALDNILIPLPPLKEQQRIVAQIEKLFEQLH